MILEFQRGFADIGLLHNCANVREGAPLRFIPVRRATAAMCQRERGARARTAGPHCAMSARQRRKHQEVVLMHSV